MPHTSTSPWTVQSLESARWSGPGSTVTCRICGADNRRSAISCRQCFAPLAVRFPTGRKATVPQLVAVLGQSGVGKTCYLGLLADLLARGSPDLHVYSHGAVSVAMQQQAITCLSNRRFPPATPLDPSAWFWMHCDIQTGKSKRPLEVIVPDVSGEATLHELEGSTTQFTLRRLVRHGAAAVVLVDGAELSRGKQESEFAALKILGSLLPLSVDKKQKRWSDRPIALVVTKTDQCDWAADAPEEFIRRQAPGLWRLCREQFRHTRCFASSVAVTARARDLHGAETEVLLRTEPRGILPPFLWLLEQI